MTRVPAALALTAALLAGCDDSTPSVAPTATATPTVTVTAGVTSSPTAKPFPANTLPDNGEPSGAPQGLQVVRSATQAGYDRVVFQLAGKAPGRPGWHVEYVDKPTQDGSGDPVRVRGTAYLQVILTGVGYPADTGVPEPAVKRLRPTDTAAVREVVLTGVFEGQYASFVGVTSKLPFRVFRLSNPERVVVDVRSS